MNWDRHYDNAKSRSIYRPSWCPITNRQDGLSYRRMAKEHPEYYGVFIALVLVCSKHPPIRDGWLTDDGKPASHALDMLDLELKTGFDADLIQKALDYLCTDRVKWIRTVQKGELNGRPAKQQPAEPPVNGRRRLGQKA